MNNILTSPSTRSGTVSISSRIKMLSISHAACFQPSYNSAIWSPTKATTKVPFSLLRLLQNRERQHPRQHLPTATHQTIDITECPHLLPHTHRLVNPHQVLQLSLGAVTDPLSRENSLRKTVPMGHHPNQPDLSATKHRQTHPPGLPRYIRI